MRGLKQVPRKLRPLARCPARLFRIARTAAGMTRSDFVCPAYFSAAIQQVSMGR
jgi:hypothetical protein